MARHRHRKQKELKQRNPVAQGMQVRYGAGKQIFHDRREPRGGAKNDDRELQDEFVPLDVGTTEYDKFWELTDDDV